MYTMGIDIGSASSKIVVLEKGKDIAAKAVVAAGTGTSGPKKALEEVLGSLDITMDRIRRTVVTGYGRMTYQAADDQISEISCHAKGVIHLNPRARTIIDIGGQDAKVIRLDEKGTVVNFVMNDKCAAGTGRFLEVMARVLETSVDKMADLSMQSRNPITISSTCTVFAESEVISQLSQGIEIADVTEGIHNSVARRVAGLIKRIGVLDDIIITGGVAQNLGIVTALEKELNNKIIVSPYSQLTGAIGAALYAFEQTKK